MKKLWMCAMFMGLVCLAGCLDLGRGNIARNEAVGPMPPPIDPNLPGDTNGSKGLPKTAADYTVTPEAVNAANAHQMLEKLDNEMNRRKLP